MSFEIPRMMLGELTAAADLSAKQFYGVKVDTNAQIALAAVGDCCIGVLQNKPKSGEAAEVMCLGVTKMSAGGTVSKGDYVAADANGQAKTAVKAATKTDDAGVPLDALLGSNVIGIALEASSGANQIIAIALLHLGAVPTTNS